MKYSIIIPTYNHFEDALKPCLDSIFKYTDLKDAELIIVANGSSNECKNYLFNLSANNNAVKLIIIQEPIGYTKAVNEGVKISTGEFIVFMNNDTILLDQKKNTWLDILELPFINDSNIGLTGPAKHFDEVTKQFFIIFFLAMTKKDILLKCGMLDEVFNPGFGEDIDYSIKVQKLGYKILRVPNDSNDISILTSYENCYPIYHAAEKTVHDSESKIKEIFGLEWEEIVNRNNKILLKRYYNNSYIDKIKHLDNQLYETIILNNEYFVNESEISGKVVIDIGANVGFFTAQCLEYNAKRVIAVEPVAKSMELLRSIIDDKRVLSIQAAVTNTLDHIIYMSDETTGSKTTVTPTPYHTSTVRLQNIMPVNNNNLILKMDCEGSEYEIIRNTPKDILRRFEFIYIEIHETDPLEDYIINCGFKMVNKQHYYMWEDQNGVKINEKEIPTRICKFERINEKVAIIMPVYNAEKYLHETLNGILTQTYRNFNLFIYNDSSTDNSIRIILEYALKDDRVKVVYDRPVSKKDLFVVTLNKNSNGSAYSRNKAVEFAKTIDNFSHFAYCDSDDIWYTNHLENSLNVLKSTKADMVYSDVQAKNDQGVYGDMYGIPYYNEFNRKELEKQNYIFISTVVHKVECFPQDGFDSWCMPKDDWDMWLRISKNHKVIHSPVKTIIYLYKTHLTYYNEEQSDAAVLRVKEKNNSLKQFKQYNLYTQKNIEYSIVIPTYNKCDELLRPCIESIIACTDLKNIEVLIIANGCTDNTKNYVESLEEPFKLIWSDEKLGYPKATNLGLRAAKGKYVVFLNNDVKLLEQPQNQWLELLKQPFEKGEKVGMTGPMLFKGEEGYSTDFIMFFCAMTTKDVLNEIGYLDEEFSPGGVEDVDFGIRLHIADYKMIQVPDDRELNPINGFNGGAFPIYHPGGSTVRNEENWDQTLINNNNKLKIKFPQYFNGIKWIEEIKTYKIYDCFPFFNELDLLEVRLEELYDLVDKFVIVEAHHTHSGKPKPLYFTENIERFTKYKDKIILHVIDFDPKETNSWIRENYQRDIAKEILKEFITDEDYVIISDLDEIPRPESIINHIKSGTESIGILQQDRFMYYVNYKNTSTDEPQLNAKIVKYKILKNVSMCYLRYCTRHKSFPYYYIPNGGWHFTFMGGIDRVIEKIKSFAHEEYDTPEKNNKERISKLIEEGKDVYDANTTWELIKLDKSFPKLIMKNINNYEKLGWIKKSINYKVFDCFMFFNEFDILEIRLNELYDVVDKFILIESRQTHSGKYKPLFYEENKNRFDKFKSKIIHIILDKFPDHLNFQPQDINEIVANSNEREQLQRNYAINYLKEVANDEDVVIISDVDEIPKKEIIKQYSGIKSLEMKLFYYNFNCKSDELWCEAKITTYKEVKNTTLVKIRQSQQNKISNAGWHFSYFGGVENIVYKIESSSHQENNNDFIKDKSRLLRLINDKQDIYNRTTGYYYSDIDESYPEFVVNKYGDKANPLHKQMKKLHIGTYEEIFVTDVYKLIKEEIENKVIIDIGANYGYFTIKCMELGAFFSFCYEPEQNNFNVLTNLINSTPYKDRILLYKTAILDGSINEVYISGEQVSANIFGSNTDQLVKCISLAKAIENVTGDLVLKLDCEGSEFEILLNTPEHILQKFTFIYLEVHENLNPKYSNGKILIKHLESLGFEIADKGPQNGFWYPDNTFVPSPIYCIKFKNIKIKKESINFIVAGKMGDFIHCMYVVKKICDDKNAKANIYITEDNINFGGDIWKFNMPTTYNDVQEIIHEQSYVNKFRILPQNFNDSYINLNDWRTPAMKTVEVYNKNWTECLSDHFGFKPPEISKWMTLMSKDSKAKNKILIHRSTKCWTEKFPWQFLLENINEEILFITTDKNEWEQFPFKTKNVSLYLVSTVSEIAYAIASCKFFIGNQSSPFAIASALDVPRFAELDDHDGRFYCEERKYSKNISWIWKDTIHMSENFLFKNIITLLLIPQE